MSFIRWQSPPSGLLALINTDGYEAVSSLGHCDAFTFFLPFLNHVHVVTNFKKQMLSFFLLRKLDMFYWEVEGFGRHSKLSKILSLLMTFIMNILIL